MSDSESDMSQIFDYFACSRPTIESWADAVAGEDDEQREQIETSMAHRVSLKGIGTDFVNILANCAGGGAVDVVKAVGALDLVQAIDEEEGPFVTAFRSKTIAALAAMTITPALLDSWVKHAVEYTEGDSQTFRTLLGAEAARQLKELCAVAVKKNFGVYTCSWV